MIQSFIERWKNVDYALKTMIGSIVSFIINVGFIVFNGCLGLIYSTSWNIAICIYYVLLGGIRGYIIFKRRCEHSIKNKKILRRRIYIKTHIMLFVMNIAMIAPIMLMVHGDKSYRYGLIPAIAMAAYTTYRITICSIHFRKGKKNKDILVRELRTINLLDAIFSLLPLQNALVIANGGMEDGVHRLMLWTSLGIYIEIMVITIRSFKSNESLK